MYSTVPQLRFLYTYENSLIFMLVCRRRRISHSLQCTIFPSNPNEVLRSYCILFVCMSKQRERERTFVFMTLTKGPYARATMVVAMAPNSYVF